MSSDPILQMHESKDLGCTCEWWRGGHIMAFDRACPILHHHRGVLWNLDQLTLAEAFDVK